LNSAGLHLGKVATLTIMVRFLSVIVTSRPRAVLATWAGILLLCAPFAARLTEVASTDSGFAPGGSAHRVAGLLSRDFSGPERPEALLVARASEETFERTVASLSMTEGVSAIRSGEGLMTSTSDPEVRFAFVTLEPGSDDEVGATLDRLRVARESTEVPDLLITGPPVVDLDIKRSSERDTRRAEWIGLPLSLLVLMWVFGSVVAALLPLISALTSVTMTFSGLYLLSHALEIAAYAQIIVTMLGLALGIDYALLLVNRFREELRRGRETRDAVVTTMSTAGSSVLFSGVTVLIALSAMLVPPLAFVRSLGAASILVIAFGILTATTITPSLLMLLGPRVNAVPLSRRTPGTRSRHIWRSWASRVVRHPRRYAALGAALLLLLAAPASQLKLEIAGVRGLTNQTDTSRAVTLLEDAGMSGLLEPYDVVIQMPDEQTFFHPASIRAVASFVRSVLALDDVMTVLAPTNVGAIPNLLVQQYYATADLARASPLRELVDATVSTDGSAVLVRVFPAQAGWQGAAALDDTLHEVAASQGLSVLVGGNRVGEREWTQALYNAFPIVIGLIFVTTFLLLAFAFRSVTLPLKSLILNGLTVAAAFGFVTFVMQLGWGASLIGLSGGLGFVEATAPLFIFAVVFGLSMDYEVFLVSRVVEAHERGATDEDAVVEAMSTTGSVITSAATIMVIVFSVFLLSDVVLVKTLALGLAVAVFLDATLVRSLLVPSSVVLLGRWNWAMPGLLARAVHRVGFRPHGISDES